MQAVIVAVEGKIKVSTNTELVMDSNPHHQVPPSVLMEMVQDPAFREMYMETPSHMNAGDRFTLTIERYMQSRRQLHNQQGGAIPSTSNAGQVREN